MGEAQIASNSNVLIAVDDSKNSRRAVEYAGDMLKSMEPCHIHLLHILNEPEEDFFPSPGKKQEWLSRQKAAAERFLSLYQELLVKKGIPPRSISTDVQVKFCPSIAECILTERIRQGCMTLIIGRKGVSREEEFLFGSVSNRLIHQAKNCAVWVVE